MRVVSGDVFYVICDSLMMKALGTNTMHGYGPGADDYSLPILTEPEAQSTNPVKNTHNTGLHLPKMSPDWLIGRGTFETPTRNGGNHHQTKPTNITLPVVCVRSQTVNGDNETSRQNFTNNPKSRQQNKSLLIHVNDRNSNSAPSPVAGRKQSNRLTNHDRKLPQAYPPLPKINKLVQAGGVSTQSQSKHILAGSSKRWATTWADARVHQLLLKSKEHRGNDGTEPSPRSSQESVSQHSTKRTEKIPQNKKLTKTTSHMHSDVSGIISKTYHQPKTEITDKNTQLEKRGIHNIKQKYSKDDFIDSPISSAYATNAVHVNTIRTGVFVDYKDVQQMVNTRKTRNPVHTTCSDEHRDSRQCSQASNQSTPRSVSYIPIPKCKRPILVTKKSMRREKNLNSIYNNKTFKVQRKSWILKKMEILEKQSIEKYNKNIEDDEKRLQESTLRQRQDLKKVRDKFDADQVKRFKRQYVSWKSVETERLTRSQEVYGLPDNIYDDRYDRTLKDVTSEKTVKRKKKSFHQYATWIKNIKRFESILNPSILGNPESMKSHMPAIVEGIDTVQLSNKGPKSKTKPVKVQNVIGSAKRLLSAKDNLDVTSMHSLRVANNNARQNSLLSSLNGDVDYDDDLSLSDNDDAEGVVTDTF